MADRYGFKPEYLPTTTAQPIYPHSNSSHVNPNSLYPATPFIPRFRPTVEPIAVHNPGNSSLVNPNSLYPANRFIPPFRPTVQPIAVQSVHNQAFRWAEGSACDGCVPPTAVHGGVDADGHAIYVGRAHFHGDLIPAKVIPGKNAAYVAHNGQEHLVQNYQLLCRQDFEWVPSHGGHLPPGAVQGGHTSSGEPLYIGRAHYEGSHTIGKIHPSHGVCYIPFGGQEVACSSYETLVLI